MLTRRSLLKHSALLSMAPAVPAFLSRTAMAAQPERDGRVLVVVQLDGGNDGINTVVPFGDEDYARHRRELRIPTDRVCKLTDRVDLHPSMRAAADMVQDGRLAWSIGSPVSGSICPTAWNWSATSATAGSKPCPFSVMTCTMTGAS